MNAAPENHQAIESQTVAPEGNAAQHDFAGSNDAGLSYNQSGNSYNNLPNTEHNTITMDGQQQQQYMPSTVEAPVES